MWEKIGKQSNAGKGLELSEPIFQGNHPILIAIELVCKKRLIKINGVNWYGQGKNNGIN